MKNIKNIIVNPTATVREALKILDSGHIQIIFVVDQDNLLLGSISDGDIRRGILNGLMIDDSIEPIIHRDPLKYSSSDAKNKIYQIALMKKIRKIPLIDSKGILIGVSDIDDLISVEKHDNIVVLMAGGLGTRLRPLTENIPKPLLKVGSKPILETIIENFIKYGYKNFIISINYKAHMIEEYFGSGEKWDIDIEYIHENQRMGTAGALSLIRKKLDKPFFVMNGDLLTNVNFENLKDFHKIHNSVATMAVREYDFQVPYGVVNSIDSKISSIVEKPVHNFFVNAGIYLLNPEVLNFIPDNQFFDMPTLFELLIKETRGTYSFPIREYWLDIGRIDDFERANEEYIGVFG